MSTGQVKIAIVGDDSAISKTLQGVEGKLSDFGSRAGSTFAGVFGALTAQFSVGAIVGAIGGAFDKAQEWEKLNAQTAAVLKSTGDASKTTAEQIGGLAEQLQASTSVSREQIQAGENMLLTFTNVKNVAGAGNDVFTQSTKILTDMSVALGEDMPTAAIQLGKALNDPLTGMTALQRVGVTFDAQQKATIKTLYDSGNVMGAQKIILAELNKEFGGSGVALGQTTAGRLAIFKDQLSDIGGKIAEAVLPALTTLGGMAVNVITPAFEGLGRLIAPITGAFSTFAKILGLDGGGVAGGVNAAEGALVGMLAQFGAGQGTINTFATVYETLSGALMSSYQLIATQVVPAVRSFAGKVRDELAPPVDRLWHSFQDNVEPVIRRLFGYVQTDVIPAAQSLGDKIAPMIGAVAALGANLAGDFFTVVKWMSDHFGGLAGDVFHLGVNLAGDFFTTVKWMADHFGAFLPVLVGVAAGFAAWKIAMGVSAAWTFLIGLPELLAARLVPAFWALNGAMDANPVGAIVLGIAALAGLAVLVIQNWGPVSAFFAGLWGGITSGFQTFVNYLIDGLNKIIDSVDWVGSKLPGPLGFHIDHIPHWGGSPPITSSGIGSIGKGTPGVQKFHSGGVVQGRPGQEVPAILQAGETVIPAGAGGANGVHVHFNGPVNNVDALTLAAEASWAWRTRGR